MNAKAASEELSEKIRAVFQENVHRSTRPRQLIADRLVELAESGQDFSAEDLWHSLQRLDVHLGRATVFRAVEMLINLGLLNRIDFADGSHTYRACGDIHHHHMTCRKCHRVVEIGVCIPEEKFLEIGRKAGFAIEGHSLSIFGVCADCQT